MIHVSDLYKSYGQDEVLKGINLTVKSGEIVVIIGPSGTGKSTLLRCINRLETPDKGSVRVGGLCVPEGVHKEKTLVGPCVVRQPLCSRIMPCLRTRQPWKISWRGW